MIDWDRVAELQEEIGDDDFVEVGALFFTEMQERLDSMISDGATADDFHFLRGSATNLGLEAFAALCAQAEARAKAGETVDPGPLQPSFDAARAEMADLFAA